jgi:hypothetical protein
VSRPPLWQSTKSDCNFRSIAATCNSGTPPPWICATGHWCAHVSPTRSRPTLRRRPSSQLIKADDWVELVRRTLSGMHATLHMVTNHVTTLDGDEANCIAYVQARHHLPSEMGGGNQIMYGCYKEIEASTPILRFLDSAAIPESNGVPPKAFYYRMGDIAEIPIVLDTVCIRRRISFRFPAGSSRISPTWRPRLGSITVSREMSALTVYCLGSVSRVPPLGRMQRE